ncbi:kelch-like protein 40a [Drosophila albomicans]|uniref:Kelch-like protein 40a n=1 Tax=Drosophila albomicans TaxID=7291 RepID=A0A9C6WEQ4_DROAB|nr:kelch-like protein 40a [Drosophila albomicans]
MNWLGKALTAIVDSERNTDCKFIINDKVYLGHKLIFSCASEVFERMCYGNFTEGTTGEIKLTDVEPETFVMFRNFIYSGDSQIKCDDVEQIIKLLEFGHKYLVSSIKDACVDKLRNRLTRCNVIELLAIYQCSHVLSCSSLFIEVNSYLKGEAREIVNQANIFDFPVHTFKHLIIDLKGCIQELQRFNLIEEYLLKNTATLNGSIVKEFLDLISFEKFTLKDFYKGPRKSKLLDLQRKYELIKLYSVV